MLRISNTYWSFHCNSGCMSVHQCYVICALPVLSVTYSVFPNVRWPSCQSSFLRTVPEQNMFNSLHDCKVTLRFLKIRNILFLHVGKYSMYRVSGLCFIWKSLNPSVILELNSNYCWEWRSFKFKWP